MRRRGPIPLLHHIGTCVSVNREKSERTQRVHEIPKKVRYSTTVGNAKIETGFQSFRFDRDSYYTSFKREKMNFFFRHLDECCQKQVCVLSVTVCVCVRVRTCV